MPGDPLLSSVSVFDSRTANVHVDEVNDVAYTPFPMRALERLAKTCQDIRKRINAEIRALEQQTPKALAKPQCHDGTAVGKLITALSGSTKVEDVRGLATLDENARARLDTLTTDLGTNPAKVARQVEALKHRLNAANASFASLQNAVNDQQVSRLTALHQVYRTTQAVATAAAGDLFSGEPLPNIGSAVWRALWEAARRYSAQQAYPDMPFPMTARRCALRIVPAGTGRRGGGPSRPIRGLREGRNQARGRSGGGGIPGCAGRTAWRRYPGCRNPG